MDSTPRRPRFDTTHWSVILAARGSASAPARHALATLCEAYWYPLYAYARQQGYAAEDARDLTQGFFASLIERRDLRSVRPELGRFRTFLLTAFRHFMLDDLKRARALKRGGGQAAVPLELDTAERRYVHEPRDDRTPEAVFDRRWALTVLERVVQALRQEWHEAGKAADFDALKDTLMGDSPPGGYAALAAEFGITEGALKVRIHRLRRRYQQLLRQQIAETVATDAEVNDEIRCLRAALRP